MHRHRKIVPSVDFSRASPVSTIPTSLIEVEVDLVFATSFDFNVDFLCDWFHAYSMYDFLVMVVTAERYLHLSLQDTPYFITGAVRLLRYLKCIINKY